MPIVWSMPDGSIAVSQISERVLDRERQRGESTAEAVQRLALVMQAKTPGLRGGVPTLVPSANMPVTRVNRDRWQLNGDQVTVKAVAIA